MNGTVFCKDGDWHPNDPYYSSAGILCPELCGRMRNKPEAEPNVGYGCTVFWDF